MDHYPADLAAVVDALDLHDLVVVGHSTGGGEVVRYAAQYGKGRVAKVVTAGAVPPIMVKSESNPPEGTPIEAFDQSRAALLRDRSQFYQDLALPFFGANRAGSSISKGLLDDFWRQSMLVNMSAAYDCIKRTPKPTSPTT